MGFAVATQCHAGVSDFPLLLGVRIVGLVWTKRNKENPFAEKK